MQGRIVRADGTGGPTITTQPQSATVTSGQPAAFTVGATGTTLSYQWRRDGVAIAGATNPSFTIPNAFRADADYYDVVVYDGLTPLASNTVRLSVAPAQYPGLVVNDPASNLALTRPQPNNSIVKVAGNGSFYVVGDFMSVNGQPRSNLARFNSDGTLDTSFAGPKLDRRIDAVLPLSNGKVLVGGYFSFTGADGTRHDGLIRLNSDGSVDESMPRIGIGSGVDALELQADGDILVGGNFGTDGTISPCLARLNADGSADTGFQTNLDGTVWAIQVQPGDGKILIGGEFTKVGNTNRNRIARLNTDGSLDAGFDPGTGADNRVRRIAALAGGQIAVVGWFDHYNGTSVGHIARLASTGALDTSFNAGTGSNGGLEDVVALAGGQLLIAGSQNQYNGVSTVDLSRLNSDGTLDTTFNVQSGGGGASAIAVESGGTLLFAGRFSSIGGANRQGLARLSSAGALDASVNNTFVIPGQVHSMTNAPGGKMLVAGNFTTINGTAVNRIGRLNANGGVDSTFNIGSGPDYDVDTVSLLPSGQILVMGGFRQFDGQSRPGVAWLNSDGSLDPAKAPAGNDWIGNIQTPPVVLPSGRILAATNTWNWGGAPVYGLLVLNPDGTRDSSFAIGSGVGQGSDAICSMALQSDGKVLIGGRFTSFNGQAVNRLARLDSDGSRDTTFNASLDAWNNINAIIVQPDGKIVIGGWRNTYNDTNWVRLNSDGTPDASWTAPGIGVAALLPQEDGKTIVGDGFDSVNGAPNTRNVARLGPDGSLDSTFGVTGQPTLVDMLALTDGGQLWSASRDSANADGLVRYATGTPPAIGTQPISRTGSVGDTVTFSVSATANPSPTYQWTHNGLPISGATNATLTITNAQSTDAGSYRVTATNTFGNITSDSAVLSGPNPPPTITTKPTVEVAQVGTAASLSVTAAGVGPLSYQWSHDGDPITGATNSTLNFSSVSATDAGRYDVSVTDGLSATASDPGWILCQATPGLFWTQGAVGDAFGAPCRPTARPVADGASAVAAGGGHSLFLKRDGSLWATGANSNGQLGDGTTTDRAVPFNVADGILFMAAGDAHSLFVKQDGSLWAMGANANGQLGDGTTIDRSTPVHVADGVVAVAAGWRHSLFIKQDGTLWAMGANASGQLGDGTTTDRDTPVQVADGVAAVWAGTGCTLFLKKDWDGTLWAMGNNGSGQLGDGTTASRSTPVQVASGVVAAAAGDNHIVYLKRNLTLWAVGANESGQLGDGTKDGRSTPVEVSDGVRAVSAAGSDTMFVKFDGTLWAAGANGFGQLGDGTRTDRSTAVQVAGGVASVSGSGTHTLYLGENGMVWAAGADGNGQLGDGIAGTHTALVAQDVVAGKLGRLSSLFVKGDGTAWRQVQHDVAAVSGGSDSVDAAVAHYDFTPICLKRDGTLWLVAKDGTSTQVASGVVACGSGLDYIAYIKSDGTLWGQNVQIDSLIEFGDAGVPRQVADHVTSMSAGGWHLLYIKTDHTLWGMGTAWGTLDGDWSHWTSFASTPVQIDTDVREAYANHWQNLYLKMNGDLWTRGQGWNEEATGPAALVDSGVTAFACDGTGTWYLKSDGVLRMRAGIRGTLGPVVDVAGGVVTVSGGNDGSGVGFIQQAGYGSAPTITVQPQSGTVNGGDSITLQVTTGGTGPLAYQWYKDDIALPYGMQPTLPIARATSADRGTYACIVTNSAGTVTSDKATISVVVSPAIADQTPWQEVFAGNDANFSVSATDAESFQWQSSGDGGATWSALTDGGVFSGAATATLTVRGVTADMSGRQFRCIVANSDGSVTSAPAAITTIAEPSSSGLFWGQGGMVAAAHVRRPVPRIVMDGVATVALGIDHMLILKLDGSLWAVGDNSSGQLGDDGPNRSVPTRMSGGVTAIAAGGGHSLYIDADRALWAVGNNANGELGDGTTTNRSAPVQVASGVAAVAAGGNSSFYIKADGTLWGMGANADGELGDGTTTDRSAPIEVASGVAAVAAGGGSTFFVKSDGTLWAAGQVTGRVGAPAQIAAGVSSVAAPQYSALGQTRALFVKTDGTLWSVGATSVQTQVADGVRSASLSSWGGGSWAAQSSHSLYIKSDGTLWLAGTNRAGELGDGTTTDRGTYFQLESGVTAAVAGAECTAFVKSDGTLWTMGEATDGRLGDGVTAPDTALLAPQAVSASVGFLAGAFVENDGTAWTQVCDRTFPVNGISNAVGVSLGNYDINLLCLEGDGSLWLARPDGTKTQVADDVIACGSGLDYICWLKRDGTLWGQNIVPEPNGGDYMIIFGSPGTPAKVADHVVSLSASGWHLLYVKSDNTLWGMGTVWSTFDGDWSHWSSYMSTPLQLDTDVREAAANPEQNVYLKTDGTLWTRGSGWGDATGNGPAVEVDTDVVGFGCDGTGTWYYKQDQILRSRTGNLGTLGPIVEVAGGVLAVTNGTGAGVGFIQQAGFGVAPAITQPQSASIGFAETRELQVVASGTGPIAYQWYKDGAVLPYGKRPELPIVYATGADAGSYTCVVSNSAGTVTSAAAVLTVVPAPTISGFSPATFGAGGSVVISGANFIGVTGVQFNGIAASSFTVDSPTQITAVVPIASLTDGPITVEATGGSVGSSASFTYHNAPMVTTQPGSITVNVGDPAHLAVVAVGTLPLTFQWKKNGTPIADATNAAFDVASAQTTDTASYTVDVGNTLGSVTSNAATIGVVPPGTMAVHGIVGGGYVPGSPVTITNTFTYTGPATSLGWSVLLPDGWSYASGSNEGDVKPAIGATSVIEWAWTTPPRSPVTFTYTLATSAADSGTRQVSALAILRDGDAPIQLLVKPDPLVIDRLTTHSADENRDLRISLLELTRVIELYNTRNGTVRTGAYSVQDGTEDGFTTDAVRSGTDVVTLTRYHSADENHDGKIDLLELTRVIELYNYRAGTVRTGQYHVQAGTEDGFAPGQRVGDGRKRNLNRMSETLGCASQDVSFRSRFRAEIGPLVCIS